MIRLKIWYPFAAWCCCSVAAAQVPNGNFEQWTGNTPNGWATSNAPPAYTNVTPSTTAHGGTYSARGDVVAFSTAVIQPLLQSGSKGQGFAFSQRVGVFTGYYEFTPLSGDRFGINVALFKGGASGTLVALAAAALSTTVSTWTQFSVPFVYQTADIPDTCIVQIQIVGPGTGAQATPHVGSYYLLDDLALSGTTSVDITASQQPQTLQLEQNYPNPFNPSTSVGFSIPVRGRAHLAVYNALGQEVAMLVDGMYEPGHYTVSFEGFNLPSGIYFCRLVSGEQTIIRKMSLLK